MELVGPRAGLHDLGKSKRLASPTVEHLILVPIPCSLSCVTCLLCLNQLNETMKKKKRRIILFVDATSHILSKKLSNVHVKFLPPHLTSELQPLDQGIIQAMKANYRKSILHSLLAAIGKFNTATEFAKSISLRCHSMGQ